MNFSSDPTISIIIKAKDEFSSVISGVIKNSEELQNTLMKVGVVAGATFAGLSAIMISSVKEASAYEAAQNRVGTIVRNVGKIHGKSTEEIEKNIKALNDQTRALEKVGVVDKNNISIVQSQLATFDMSSEAIQRLTPSILDYVVAEKGASASTEEFRQMTNGLAQALNGNYASLTRSGFIIDDATKAIIENGTEMEKAEAIARVLSSTYDGMNKSAQNTAEGAMILLNRSLGDIKETIGNALLPILRQLIDFLIPIVEKVGAWIKEHQRLSAAILLITAGLSLLVFGIVAVTMAMTALMAVSWPVVAIILLIALVIGALIAVFLYWGEIVEWLKEKFEPLLNFLRDWFAPEIEAIKLLMTLLGIAFTYIWENYIKPWWENLKGLIGWLKDTLMPIIEKVIDTITSAIKKYKDFKSSIGDKISAVTEIVKGASGSSKKVNDAIITPKGIVQTHPDDYIIATKNPSSLGGGGITLIIEGNVYGVDAEEISDALFRELKYKINL